MINGFVLTTIHRIFRVKERFRIEKVQVVTGRNGGRLAAGSL
jgi:hypothetical protein